MANPHSESRLLPPALTYPAASLTRIIHFCAQARMRRGNPSPPAIRKPNEGTTTHTHWTRISISSAQPPIFRGGLQHPVCERSPHLGPTHGSPCYRMAHVGAWNPAAGEQAQPTRSLGCVCVCGRAPGSETDPLPYGEKRGSLVRPHGPVDARGTIPTPHCSVV